MSILSADGLSFVTERHLATLSTPGRRGRLHVVAVGFTYEEGVVRIITSRESQKVLNVRRGGTATVGQVDGIRWLSLGGPASIEEEPDAVAHAVELYSQRYRVPRENPLRVAIRIDVDLVLGSAGLRAE
ncbi:MULTISPECIES: pyridoxamine 5'-phosphate oxidase family protein [unclassified Rathayibacter]|uniref:pyridoxamine 5'-phosphate oxidase family protein n=1 Tax=unclassified Rathayibacter TaxID=2609250 RepID=UPI00188D6599|nr:MULTISPECIES: pyridoxamine 5'-phosphate oxidase family protein [unclassified Rathayibacter]MBF4461809.1 pyridoxamine 5'-phosphate oxidase family protein [Rathayibacter sp. VKM Ac-2879]MBF4503222.1 pyridoxamine 5'-phosphate oxidase family protein [Rathayibacter sp. VKM Ac-2878]